MGFGAYCMQWTTLHTCARATISASVRSRIQRHSPCNVILFMPYYYLYAECPLFSVTGKRVVTKQFSKQVRRTMDGAPSHRSEWVSIQMQCVGIQCAHNQQETIFGGLTRDWRLSSCSCIQRRTANDNNSRRTHQMFPNIVISWKRARDTSRNKRACCAPWYEPLFGRGKFIVGRHSAPIATVQI